MDEHEDLFEVLAGPGVPPSYDATFSPLDEMAEDEASFVWKGFVPRGGLTLLEGKDGVGKSSLTLDLAARVSSGSPMPGETEGREPMHVFLAAFEDYFDGDNAAGEEVERTVMGRLREAGADLTRVAVLPDVRLPYHVGQLQKTVKFYGAALLVLDPLRAALDDPADFTRATRLARVLERLHHLAGRTNCAVVIVRHRTRDDRPLGPNVLGQVPRSCLLLEADPDDDVRVLRAIKHSWARRPSPMRFQIVEGTNGIPKVEWWEH